MDCVVNALQFDDRYARIGDEIVHMISCVWESAFTSHFVIHCCVFANRSTSCIAIFVNQCILRSFAWIRKIP